MVAPDADKQRLYGRMDVSYLYAYEDDQSLFLFNEKGACYV
jgi:hypothetical protein